MKTVSIIDYGLGNLFSVKRAFEHCGAFVKIICTPEEISDAERLVLPGVGAFGTGMRYLTKLNLINSIKNFAHTDKPFLGICLGMQLMLSSSEEFGHHLGLNLIEGSVLSIPAFTTQEKKQKLPHIGWSQIEKTNSHPVLPLNMNESDWMYFVHSFVCKPNNPENNLAISYYGGHELCALIRKNNIIGCQFHPEKSGKKGLNFLSSFLEL